MKLDNGRFCLDCEEITDLAVCPACASRALSAPIKKLFDYRYIEVQDTRQLVLFEKESKNGI